MQTRHGWTSSTFLNHWSKVVERKQPCSSSIQTEGGSGKQARQVGGEHDAPDAQTAGNEIRQPEYPVV